ncbi:OmpA family protein [Alcanivorax jadensis]|uniref:OmpA family protein n=1 Tax=Alcanivorax jadensis TaxID=64988 RepID=UPI00240906CA|nr:OmpA family protein [Alcanivorax jadensis]MDF1638683.1 OmpA family protein [Alcanivorax jadensis]
MNRFVMAAYMILAAVLSGCASNEALFAEYDEVCPVQARVTDTGMVMVTALASAQSEGQLWEPAVYFGFDEHGLIEDEIKRLDRNLVILKQYPALQISIQAFTDQLGGKAYNRALAEKRMDQVSDYLQENGLDSSRIKQAPLGKELPILPSDNEQDRIVNRRVELMPLDAQGRPLVLRVDFQGSGGDSFVAPEPVR